MFLNGFGFSAYRSYGDALVNIAPLRKVNLIIGQNNVGKSNIINFLARQYQPIAERVKGGVQRVIGGTDNITFAEIDRHISSEPALHRVAFPLLYDDVDGYLASKGIVERNWQGLSRRILQGCFPSDENGIWFVYESNSPVGAYELSVDVDNAANVLSSADWYRLWTTLTSQEKGDLKAHWVPETLRHLSYIPTSFPKIEVIPAVREVGQPGTAASDFSGQGIIERLAKIQNPPLTEQKDKEKFLAINKFLEEVLESPKAALEIPYERNMILVHMDGKTLPLESLGTGVHEVIILAAAATLLENAILCVEEPELHLHPLLQKKLVNYLASETNNQHIFTTHSAHLLDAVEAEIFHVTQHNGVSSVDAVFNTKHRADVCHDLGYRASDILQANCVIWVEGPSDRIYLNYWIQGKRSDLMEGVHYAIMFYGGRLFSHITALDYDEDERIEDFISVRSLNRNSSIMFDSDKSGPRARLNSTKKRLQEEFSKGPGFAWVTRGREVENYLDAEKVEEAVLKVHPSAAALRSKDQWSNTLHYSKRRTKKTLVANKVKVAKHYTAHNVVDYTVLDLNEKVDKVVRFILKANGCNDG